MRPHKVGDDGKRAADESAEHQELEAPDDGLYLNRHIVTITSTTTVTHVARHMVFIPTKHTSSLMSKFTVPLKFSNIVIEQ